MSAQNFLESVQNFDFGTQNWQTRHFFIFLVQFDKVFFFKYAWFMAIFVHTLAQNYIKKNSDRTKEFTFKMSVCYHRGQTWNLNSPYPPWWTQEDSYKMKLKVLFISAGQVSIKAVNLAKLRNLLLRGVGSFSNITIYWACSPYAPLMCDSYVVGFAEDCEH